MKKHYNSWEDHMGKRLQKLEGESAFDAWDRIEAELDEKPRRNWLLIAAVFAFLALPATFFLLQDGSWNTYQQQELAKSEDRETDSGTKQQEPAISKNSGTRLQRNQNNSEKASPEVILTPATSAGSKEAYALQQSQNEPTQQLSPALIPAPSGRQAAASEDPLSEAAIASAASATKNNSIAQKQRTEATSGNKGIIAGFDKGNALAATGRESAKELARKKDSGTSGEQAVISAGGISSSEFSSASAVAGSTSNGRPSSATAALPMLTAKAPDAFPLEYTLPVPQRQWQYEPIPKAIVASRQEKKNTGTPFWTELMPTWSYRRIEPNPSDAVVITAMESQPAFSSSRIGAQAAMGVSVPVQKNLEWKSGAFYGFQQQQWSYTYRNAEADSYRTSYSVASGYSLVPEYTAHTNEIKHNLHNLGLTTGFSYKLPAKFAANFLDARLLTYYNSMQKLNSFITLGYTIELPLDADFGIHVGPSLQFHVHSSETISPHFQEKPLVFGIQLGASLNKP